MFYYYGAKSRLAPKYPRPEHDLIIEPFAGSAGYSMHWLGKIPGARALLAEKDKRVVNNWRRCLASEFSLPDIAPGERTEDFLYMCCAASNALAKCKTFKFSERAGRELARMRSKIEKCRSYALGRVSVVNGTYESLGDVEATWFIDPPYVPQEGARSSNPAGKGYASGCDSDSIDYKSLAEWCKSRRGQVIVCEQVGAGWLPFEPLVANRSSTGRVYKEAVWLK